MDKRVLIVDDEDLIRQGMIARLQYLNLKPVQLYEAESGLAAIEILKSQPVDIVITDIRMADMDGLTLIRRVKSFLPDIHFIIISGYAEFEYAEQAIRLGVTAYLLKPISNEALKKAVEEVAERIDEKKKEKQMIQKGIRSMEENRTYLFEKTVNDLLLNQEAIGAGTSLETAVFQKFPLLNRYVMVMIIHIDGDSYDHNYFECKDIDLIQFSIKNVFMEVSSPCGKLIVSNLGNSNQLYGLTSHENKNQLRLETERLLTIFSNVMRKKLRISLTVGVSTALMETVKNGVEEARESLTQRVIHGNSNLYFYDDIRVLSADQFPVSELNMLRRYIERHDPEHIEVMIQDIFSDENIKKYNTSYVRILWTRITNMILSLSATMDPDKIEKLVMKPELFASFHSLEDLRRHLYLLIMDCMNADADPDGNAKNKVKLSIKYIRDNYNRDISVNELAEKYSLSPNYYSTIFKRETGQTTVNYIKELRLNKACDYLVNTGKSIADISKEVGYEDSQYFFRVFKKTTGLTPLEYRKAHRR